MAVVRTAKVDSERKDSTYYGSPGSEAGIAPSATAVVELCHHGEPSADVLATSEEGGGTLPVPAPPYIGPKPTIEQRPLATP